MRDILKAFSLDLTAEDRASLTGVSRNAINRLFMKLRYRLCALSQQSEDIEGEVELDESYFGARRIRGKRGRGRQDPALWPTQTEWSCLRRNREKLL